MVQTITEIQHQIQMRESSVEEVVANSVRLAEDSNDSIWITRIGRTEIRKYTERLHSFDATDSPLYGIPFAIKDNIDLEGVPTTVGCPDFATTPQRSAFIVERLLSAGAIPVGKTNMDQFATGLTGTRSPYGIVQNAVNADYISGGSSSGSACAVAAGIVPFALGTDTAGSGRVPAAFQGLVGFKPTRGWWSTRGVYPACRSLDCVSVFTNSVTDARTVAKVVGDFDVDDPFSRKVASLRFPSQSPRIGFFDTHELSWEDETYAPLYQAFIDDLPAKSHSVDPELFIRTGDLLYHGPWLAERLVGLGEFLATHPESLHPITRTILEKGCTISASECFRAQHQLAELKREIDGLLEDLDVLLAPTCLRHFTIKEVESDPIGANNQLGTLTNFVNLLDLCAIAIPTGVTSHGLPFGVTMMAKAGYDHALLDVAATLMHEEDEARVLNHTEDHELIAVCAAHMSGQPLNHQLTSLEAWHVATTTTSAHYRLYALADGKRAGLTRQSNCDGSIEVEVWSIPRKHIGELVAQISEPLALGRLELHSGQWVAGFVLSGEVANSATNITAYGGWSNYQNRSI